MTASMEDELDDAETPDSLIARRKDHHLDICLRPQEYAIESQLATGFGELRFVHESLPELDAAAIDTTVPFLGHTLSTPLLISCMTGGSGRGRTANRMLAAAAQHTRIAVGLGSIRPLLEDAALFDHFHIKPLAPDVPVLANVGAAQLRTAGGQDVLEMTKRLEAQALVVHLNPGQELFQPEGERDFGGLLEAIQQLVRGAVPSVVKETGFGIRPRRVRQLLAAGVSFVDLAGAGGSNWVLVEGHRLPELLGEAAAAFADWGLPTAVLLAALPDCGGKLIASGGLRDGVSVAKAVALGARLGAMALPFIRDVVGGGVDAVVSRVEAISTSVRAAMTLTGAANLAQLARVPLLRSAGFRDQVAELRRVEES